MRIKRTRPGQIAAILAIAALLASGLAACSGASPGAEAPPAAGQAAVPVLEGLQGVPELRQMEGLEQEVVGAGTDSAVIVWKAGEERPRDAVVFLHAWGPLLGVPWVYEPWLRHLAGQGLAVIYPVIQDRETRPGAAVGSALKSTRLALAAVRPRRATLVVFGHTTGGVIAAHLAVRGSLRADYRPAAVFALYPGRNPLQEESIPLPDFAKVAPKSHFVVASGPQNPVLRGKWQARRMFRLLPGQLGPRKRFLRIETTRGVTPWHFTPAAQAAYWAPLDRLIAEVRK